MVKRSLRLTTVVSGLLALTVITRPTTAEAQTPAQPPAAAQGPVIQLTMAQAEQMALENNLGLKADRLSPIIADENLALARAPFNPTLSAAFNRRSSQSPSTSAYEGKDTITSSSLGGSTTVSQVLPWFGSQYSMTWETGRNNSDRAANPYNPQLTSGLRLNITQPLLAGFKIDGNRANLQNAQRNRSIADIDLDERITITKYNAHLAYLALIAARNQRDVSIINLDIARQQLKDNQARVEVGTMAPIDIIEGEAEVARNEESVIRAEAAIAAAEDNLRPLLLDAGRPDYWQVRFEPTDMPTLTPRDVDIDAAVATALKERTDLVSARLSMENTDLSIRVARNSLLPEATLQVNYVASGSGGTQNQWDLTNPALPVLVGSTTRGFWTVATDSFKNNLPTWTIGLNLRYPLGRSSQEASLARQRIQRQQQETQLRAQELNVVTAVRAVGRDVQTNFQRVRVTQVARERADKQLEAEQKKFAVGLSNTFTLQQRQRDLASARVNELNAISDYNRSLIQFDAIQKAPVR